MTVKHGGELLIFWKAILALATEPLIHVKDTVNQHKYIKILEHLLPYIAEKIHQFQIYRTICLVIQPNQLKLGYNCKICQ